MSKTSPANVYFATLTGKELAQALEKRIETFDSYVADHGLLDLWRLSYQAFYSQDEDGFTAHRIGKKGPKGKYAVLKINEFRSIVKNWRTLAQSKRAAMQPVAKYNDYRSDDQVKRAKLILDHYETSDPKLGAMEDEAIDLSSYLGSAFIEQGWDPEGGADVTASETGLKAVFPDAATADPAAPPVDGAPAAPVAPAEGAAPEAAVLPAFGPGRLPVERTGSLEAWLHWPTNVIVNPRLRSTKLPWVITRRVVNKWDVAARYAKTTEQYAQIVALKMPADQKLKIDLSITNQDGADQDDDLIELKTFWHARCAAIPFVKRAIFLNGELMLEETEFKQLDTVPLTRYAPGNIRGTPWGYTEAWDLLAPQKALDTLNSIAMSNMKTFGVGSIISPKGSGVKATEVTEGLKLLEYADTGHGGKPEPLQMPQTPAEVGNTAQRWRNNMGTLIGVNSVARGDPEKSLESGSALMLVQAQAVQYSSDYQKEITDAARDRSWITLLMVREFLKEAYEWVFSGDDLALSDTFDGEAIKDVVRVDIKPVNPMTKTMGGMWQMVSFLAERYPNEIPAGQLLRSLTSGNFDVITDPAVNEEKNLQRENQFLEKGWGPPPKEPVLDPVTGQPALDPMTGEPQMKRGEGIPGKSVRALITDNPITHIRKHLDLLNSQAARENPAVVKAVLDHVEEHEELYAFLTASRPGLLEIMGIPPLTAAMPMDPMAMGGPPGGPPGPGGPGAPPPGQKPPGPGVRPPGGPGPGKQAPPDGAGAPKMPQGPKHPGTGERFQPPPPQGG